MEYNDVTLGQYLQSQREDRGLSIDEAALETNIAKKYIEALEKDEYGFFPAEMYVTGFLSAYIEVLELDRDLVLSMYRRALNKEQEAPLEAFYALHKTETNFSKYSRALMVGVPVALGVILLVILSLSGNVEKSNNTPNPIVANTSQTPSGANTYTLENIKENNRIVAGIKDTVIVQGVDVANLLEIEFLGKQRNQIRFRLNGNTYVYKIGDSLNIEIDNAEIRGFNIEIVSILNNSVEFILNILEGQAPAQVASYFDITPYQKAMKQAIPVAVVTNVHKFNATVRASRPVWVGYQVDSRPEAQQLLDNSQTMEFSFIDGAKLSLGNAGAATITFAEFTNVVRGGVIGESSQSVFYIQKEGNKTTLYRAQLK